MGLLATAMAALLGGGCKRDIGDDCQTSVDCDPNGARACDLSQPGGYCTLLGCSETSCPGGSSCIRYFPEKYLSKPCLPACEDLACRTGECGEPDPTQCLPACPAECAGELDHCAADEVCLDVGLCARRILEQRYCAKNCEGNGDCRAGYECRLSGTHGSMGLSATPGATAHFCAPHTP
jgi:hypothetical protein